MAKIGRDFTPVSLATAFLHPREGLFGEGVLAAANAEVAIPGDGVSSITVDVRGTYVGTFAVEGTVDGVNWGAIPMRAVNANALAYFLTSPSAVQGIFVGQALGFRAIRVRMVAWTSGAPVFSLLGSTTPFNDVMAGLVTNSATTALSASGAAQTLTIPAPGAGLRQYLTYLSINRFAAAALTAGAAPTAVTTTNLPGSLAFTLSTEAAAQGLLLPWREDFAYPIAATTLNTAVTVVAPAVTGVIWRITAGYYIAP